MMMAHSRTRLNEHKRRPRRPRIIFLLGYRRRRGTGTYAGKICCIHGTLLDTYMPTAIELMTSQLLTTLTGLCFEVIRIDTAANRRLVMIHPQFEEYTREFCLRIPIRTSVCKSVRAIHGSGHIIGDAMIQIPFVSLCLIIDAYV